MKYQKLRLAKCTAVQPETPPGENEQQSSQKMRWYNIQSSLRETEQMAEEAKLCMKMTAWGMTVAG